MQNQILSLIAINWYAQISTTTKSQSVIFVLRYNCDKCQNSDSRTSEDGQTTEMSTQDSTDSSTDTLDTTEDTTDNSAADTTEAVEANATTESQVILQIV